MEFHKGFEHCAGVLFVYLSFPMCKQMFWRSNKLKNSTCLLKCWTCFCWNLFLHNRSMFIFHQKTRVSTVDSCFNCRFRRFNSRFHATMLIQPFHSFRCPVAPLMTWGWHRIFIVVKRDTPLLHLVSRVKHFNIRNFGDMGVIFTSQMLHVWIIYLH